MPHDPTLSIFYENWREYNGKLRAVIAPLSDDQLALRPAVNMRSLGQIVQHIIDTRAWWFNDFLKENDPSMTEYMRWRNQDPPDRTVVELLSGLDDTWAFIETRLQRWSPDDCAVTFPEEWEGTVYQIPRSWVIYHVLEHDLHHGGEVSLILGMHGLPAPDL